MSGANMYVCVCVCLQAATVFSRMEGIADGQASAVDCGLTIDDIMIINAQGNIACVFVLDVHIHACCVGHKTHLMFGGKNTLHDGWVDACTVFGNCDNSMCEKDWRYCKRETQAT